MRELFPYLKRYRLQLGLGPVFKFIEALIELILPLLMSAIVDKGINGQDSDLIRRYGILMMILVFLGVSFSFSCQYMASVASQGVGTSLRDALFKKANRMSQEQLQEYGTASLINRVNGDVNQIQVLVAMSIRLLSRSPVLAIGGVIMSFFINWRMSLVLLMIVPLAAVLLFYIIRGSTRLMKRALKQSDKVTELFTDSLAGARVIRAFAREDHERKYFAKKADQLTKSWIFVNGISGLMNPLTNLLFNGVIVFIIWRSGSSVNIGTMTQGDVLALVNYLSQIVVALMVWASLASLFPRAFAAGARISDMLQTKTPEEHDPRDRDVDKRDQATPLNETILRANELSFTYPGTRAPALEGLSFDLAAGEELGVIGATGSGKSTLAALLVALYPRDGGDLSFMGRSYDDWSTAMLREEIAWVPQKAVLFKGTIRSNLFFGMKPSEQALYRDPDPEQAAALEEKMWAALEASQAASFVRQLHDRLDAPVERGGQNLSGGQRQRLSIARALMREAKLYIFDDSSSALDYLTDAKMRKAVRRLTKDAAVVRISNRVYQLLQVDRILVLDNGQQVGLAKHDQLLDDSEIYQEIAKSQEGGVYANKRS